MYGNATVPALWLDALTNRAHAHVTYVLGKPRSVGDRLLDALVEVATAAVLDQHEEVTVLERFEDADNVAVVVLELGEDAGL